MGNRSVIGSRVSAPTGRPAPRDSSGVLGRVRGSDSQRHPHQELPRRVVSIPKVPILK